MKIILNGKEKKLTVTNLGEILTNLKYNPENVIVSVNGELVEKEIYSITSLSEGDIVDVFSFVGGG
jgi:sulfur carrier protein